MYQFLKPWIIAQRIPHRIEAERMFRYAAWDGKNDLQLVYCGFVLTD